MHAELLGAPAEDQVTSSPTVVDGSAQGLLCSSNEKQACQSPESAQQAHTGSQEVQEPRAQEPSDGRSQMLPADRAVPTRKREKTDELQDFGSVSWLPTAGAWAESLPAPRTMPHVIITAKAGGRQAGLVQPDRSSKRRKQRPELRPQALQEQQQQAVPPGSTESAGAACSNGDHATGREAGAQLQCHPSGSMDYGSTARQHPGSSPRPAAASKQQPRLEAVSTPVPGWNQRRTLAGSATAGEICIQSKLQTVAAL